MDVGAEPPAYAPPPVAADPASPRRSIRDLRAQIIANASVLRPRLNEGRSSDDHVEVVLAKFPVQRQKSTNKSTAPATHWTTEKQAMIEALEPQFQGQQPQYERPDSTSASSSATRPPEQHYAVLIRRSTGSAVKVIMKGQAQATPEGALEWMLEQTEKLVHDHVVRNGKPVDEECCMM